MGRHQAKLGAAIPIAHDGPLHLIIDEEGEEQTLGCKEALELLKQAKTNVDLKRAKSPSLRLCAIATTTSQIRDQLQALQAYRSALLHVIKIQEELTYRRTELIGCFRLLLEWSLSSMCTTPLRRAAQSSLETLADLIPEESENVMREVISSLWDKTSWNNALGSTYEALTFGLTRSIILEDMEQCGRAFCLLTDQAAILEPTIASYSVNSMDIESVPTSLGGDVVTSTEKCIEIAVTLKLLMTPLLARMDAPLENRMSELTVLRIFLWKAICCTGMHSDGLSKVTVAFAQTCLSEWQGKSDVDIAAAAKHKLLDVSNEPSLPPLNILATFQGIAATLPDEILMTQDVLQDPLASTLLYYAEAATDPAARLSALRGLHTLSNRCSSLMLNSANLPLQFTNYIPHLVESSLKIVLECWENPPGRQVASAIPGLFRSLVPLLQSLPNGNSLNALVKRILDQPPNRKGRYIALETLLPLVGPKALIDAGGDELIESLVSGVGDRGDNSAAIADLLGKLLSKLREEMNEDAGVVTDVSAGLNKKRRKKLEAEKKKEDKVGAEDQQDKHSCLLPEWVHLWAPPIANSLLSDSAIRRKQTASFCIPLMITLVGGPTRRADAGFAFAALLAEVKTQFERRRNDNGLHVEAISTSFVTLDERYIWAKLEVAVRASMLKVAGTTRAFSTALATHLPLDVLKMGLLHPSPSLRLVAFLSLEAVIPSYNINATPVDNIRVEMSMWKMALPYSFKSSGKEYMLSLFQCLISFLNRASLAEAESLAGQKEGVLGGILHFIGDFLLGDIFVTQACYPGTVADKESFGLSLLQCILAFTTQNEVTTSPGNVPRRRLRGIEISTVNYLMSTKLLSFEVFAQLVSLMHSVWDSTRSDAFAATVQLIYCGKNLGVALPSAFASEESIKSIHARALRLSSSPRQREADTGARLLGFVYNCISSIVGRDSFYQDLMQLAGERVSSMEQKLKQILWSLDGQEGGIVESRIDLPLAHGLIQALRIIADTKRKVGMKGGDQSDPTISIIIDICCNAIKLSLSVVADMKDNESVDGLDETPCARSASGGVVPININTGAIGANGVFSSLYTDQVEEKRRSATQLVVMGSWLLTKEACATLSAAISDCDCTSVFAGIAQAGTLLISLLTTLKHQGAAFAAHKSLQQIAARCYQSKDAAIRQLPSHWAQRMLTEISSFEKVRDSTLRRSTGYGLGFLSLMRSEPLPSVIPRTLCPFVLARLVQLTLPPGDEMHQQLMNLNVAVGSGNDSLFFYPSQLSQHSNAHIEQTAYDPRCRVHALNILRLIILDAPMATEVKPFIGDAIISSVLGYNDLTWAVRNSATMVFSAAMLRVIDADKNARKKDVTSGNAITVIELFRLYPALSTFLLSVLQNGVQEMEVDANLVVKSKGLTERMLHPAVFPVLLLISRLHPVNHSGEEAVPLTERFAEPILSCLTHPHHKVRVVAARAIANICTDLHGKKSTSSTLLHDFAQTLRNDLPPNFNHQHGALLAVQKILESRDKIEDCNNKDVVETLVRVASKVQTLPPSCVSVALEILGLFSQRYSETLELSMSTIALLQSAEKNGSLSRKIGAATLAVSCAQVAGSICSYLFWSGTFEERNKCLTKMSRLLQSSDIDIKLHSAKAIKKQICHSIDELLSRVDINSGEKTLMLTEVGDAMSASLTIELGISATSGRLGAHPPTVRRMSRCLLECFYAMKATNDSGHLLTTSQTLWNLSIAMLHMDNTTLIKVEEEDADNPVVGNAIEIMGFALLAASTSDREVGKRETFLALIQAYNQPLGNWRIRHSIALAIHTSKAMTIPSLADTAIVELINLLQDSDADVRFVASQTILDAPRPGMPVATTTLFALERLLHYIKASGTNRDNLVQRLFSSVNIDLQQFETMFGQLVAELQLSDASSTTSMQDVPIAQSRKIFEEEDANTYEEILLRHQFIALATVGVVTSSCSIDADELFTKCKHAIKIMTDRVVNLQCIDVVHDITRSNTIFPLLHGLLLNCAAVLFNGTEDTLGLQQDAKKLTELLERDQRHGDAIHPRIHQVLTLLASAEKGCHSFTDRVQRCCFLLPNCANTNE